MRKIIIPLIVLLSAVSLASAGPAVLDVTPLTQDIPVGTTGTYALTLTTTVAGALSWDTGTPLLSASIDGAPAGQTGSIAVGVGTSAHTLSVTPLSGITIGTPYDIDLSHTQGGGVTAKATATAGVVPIPELSTVALMSAGMIGLFGLVRVRRKD